MGQTKPKLVKNVVKNRYHILARDKRSKWETVYRFYAESLEAAKLMLPERMEFVREVDQNGE